jgi:hypothetical protein
MAPRNFSVLDRGCCRSPAFSKAPTPASPRPCQRVVNDPEHRSRSRSAPPPLSRRRSRSSHPCRLLATRSPVTCRRGRQEPPAPAPESGCRTLSSAYHRTGIRGRPAAGRVKTSDVTYETYGPLFSLGRQLSPTLAPQDDVLRAPNRMKACDAGTRCAAHCFVLGRPDMSTYRGSLRPRIALAHRAPSTNRHSVRSS